MSFRASSSTAIGLVSVFALLVASPFWASDLTATKTNDTGGIVSVGESFDWKIRVENQGTTPVVLSAGDVLLRDNLPSTNISYGEITVAGLSGVSCLISGYALSYTAYKTWDIYPVEEWWVSVEATPTAIGTYVNPTGGGCAVDPYDVVSETNELNNSCSDTVTCVDPSAPIFVDGFESGNVSAWSSSVP